MSARRIGVLAIMAVASVVLVATVVHAFVYTPSGEVAAPTLAAQAAVAQAASPGLLPERIIIPSLHINASVEDLGVKGNGAMATPTSFTTVGWYKYGVMPGQDGTAVMYGHLDNGLGLNGVFLNLHELQSGQAVDIVTKDERTLHFLMTTSISYPYQSVPASVLGAQSNAPRLSLLTCSGGWTYDSYEGMTYDHRLVVSLMLASTTPAP